MTGKLSPRTASRRMLRQVLALSAAMALWAASGLLSFASARPVPVQACWPQDQVMRGATVYATACAMCHRPGLIGDVETPSLRDPLIGRWQGAPVAALEAYIHRAMPQMAPGTLSDDDAKAVTAFILSRNAAPRGRIVRAAPVTGRDPDETSTCGAAAKR